jgi:hypothetical protein
VLFVGIPLLTGGSVLRAFGGWLDESGAVLQWLGRVL